MSPPGRVGVCKIDEGVEIDTQIRVGEACEAHAVGSVCGEVVDAALHADHTTS